MQTIKAFSHLNWNGNGPNHPRLVREILVHILKWNGRVQLRKLEGLCVQWWCPLPVCYFCFFLDLQMRLLMGQVKTTPFKCIRFPGFKEKSSSFCCILAFMSKLRCWFVRFVHPGDATVVTTTNRVSLMHYFVPFSPFHFCLKGLHWKMCTKKGERRVTVVKC